MADAKNFGRNAATNGLFHRVTSACQGIMSNIFDLHQHCNPQDGTVLQYTLNTTLELPC